ncbi:MAG: hypothetical protein ABR865_10145 [Terracidiphilus sp.]|jgi:hypothetical protein
MRAANLAAIEIQGAIPGRKIEFHKKFLAEHSSSRLILLSLEVIHGDQEIFVSCYGLRTHAFVGAGSRRPLRRQLDHKHVL